MYNKKIQKQISYLKEVSSNDKLVSEIEDFFNKNNFTIKQYNQFNGYPYEFFDPIVDKVNKEITKLSNQYGIDEKGIYFYFCMEKDFIGKINNNFWNPFNAGFTFKINDYEILVLNGSNCRYPYDNMHEEGIELFNSVLEYLPKSTKKFVENRKNTAKSNSKFKMEAISNDFQCRIFTSSLAEVPDTVLLKRYFNFLKSTDTTWSCSLAVSYIYFVKAINLKYPNNTDKKLVSFKNSLYVNTFNQFYNSFNRYTWLNTSNKKDFYLSLDLLLEDVDLMKFFFDRLIAKDSKSKLCQLFTNFGKMSEFEDKARELLETVLQKEMKVCHFNIEDMSSELKELFLKEASLKEFDVDFKEVAKNLKKFNNG